MLDDISKKADTSQIADDEAQMNYDESLIGTKADRSELAQAEKAVDKTVSLKENVSDVNDKLAQVKADINDQSASQNDDIKSLQESELGLVHQNHSFASELHNVSYVPHPNYIDVRHPVRLYHADGRYVLVTPSMRYTMRVTNAYKRDGRIRYRVLFNGDRYTMSGSHFFVKHAYLRNSDLRHGKRVRVITNCVEYRSPRYDSHTVIRAVHEGTVLHVARIIDISGHRTRLLLTNGHYVTSNRNFVKAI